MTKSGRSFSLHAHTGSLHVHVVKLLVEFYIIRQFTTVTFLDLLIESADKTI